MKQVQHGNSRDVARTPRTSKMEGFAAVFNGFVNYYCCKALHLRCLGATGYTSRNSAIVTLVKCNRKKLQHAKSLTGEECKTKTLQSVKVQHEKQYIKRVQHEK